MSHVSTTPEHRLDEIVKLFKIEAQFSNAIRFGTGHINDTYLVSMTLRGETQKYIFQRINHSIFKNPPALMENITRVTEHLRSKSNSHMTSLHFIAATTGLMYANDAVGNFWRAYHFVDKARTFDIIEHPDQAFQAATAFGEFQNQLADLPGGRLNETIPNFHHAPSRFQTLEKAIKEDCCGRVAEVGKEIDFILSRKHLGNVLLDLVAKGLIPERTTHNDTKLNNVLISESTGKGVCVIDLDTIMPGLSLYDFGDMIRTSTSPAAEDELDLSKVTMRMPYFESLVKGFLSTAGSVLTPAEKDHLAFSGKLITLIIGVRFLTDYLLGDVYFKIKYPDHNLRRCRTQIRLIESIEQQEEAMRAVVARYC